VSAESTYSKHAPAGTAMPICMSAQPNWAELSGVDRIVTTGVVAAARTFPGTNAWSPPT
jgi:hypothetical protein